MEKISAEKPSKPMQSYVAIAGTNCYSPEFGIKREGGFCNHTKRETGNDKREKEDSPPSSRFSFPISQLA